jgi:putative peptidoglycan lipid II flippase
MEFPTALLGVALGVVLTPQLAAAQARAQGDEYSSLLDWGLRAVVLLAAPCAVALLAFPQALVAVLFHYGRFGAADVAQTVGAVMGWGVGLLGIVAVKVLAPGYYARQDVRTPVRIAVAMLVVTQLLNLLLVPWMGFAALSLSIGLSALVNAGLLLRGLLKAGVYRPAAGWPRFALQVATACALLAAYLTWAQRAWDWVGLQPHALQRAGWLALVLMGACGVYFAALSLMGLPWRSFVRRGH